MIGPKKKRKKRRRRGRGRPRWKGEGSGKQKTPPPPDKGSLEALFEEAATSLKPSFGLVTCQGLCIGHPQVIWRGGLWPFHSLQISVGQCAALKSQRAVDHFFFRRQAAVPPMLMVAVIGDDTGPRP